MSRLSRRRFLGGTAGAAAGLMALGGRSRSLAQDAGRPPSIVLIMADDLSARELGCYGHPEHRTPNLDRLAATGVAFRTCWATPICSPSRAAIMTGRYGFRTNWFHNNLKTPQPLCREHLTIGQLMRGAGYATCVVGKWQLPGLEPEYGFDEAFMWLSGHPLAAKLKQGFDGPVEQQGHSLPGRTARYWHPAIVREGRLVETAADDYGPDLFTNYLNDFAARYRDRPFFAYYPMCLTHKSWDFDLGRSGYLAPPALNENGERIEGKGQPTLRANVEYMDYLVGRIVANLDALGLRETTIVIFTCDNGTVGYGKGSIDAEKGSRVPMIANCPGLVRPLGMREELADFTDVLPTLADLGAAQLPQAYDIDGHSFAPLLRGDPYAGREWIFSCYATHRMLRDRRWLLDGNGRLYDCGDKRDEEGYRDVTDSVDAAPRGARERFDDLLERLPGPSEDMRTQWQATRRRQRQTRGQRR